LSREVRSHWCRIAMYEAATRLFQDDAGKLDVLEISGSAFSDLLPWRSYRGLRGIDVCKDGWQTREGADGFNLIVLDQVLEHVSNPSDALTNVLMALPLSGRIFVSTPFLIREHPDPEDHWRWTSSGLALILERAGFDMVGSDSWGNRACVMANFTRWVRYRPEEHSLVNETNFPVTVWAWGTKTRACDP
jgi:hypothetical protein